MGMADQNDNNPLHEQLAKLRLDNLDRDNAIADLRIKNREVDKRVSDYFRDLVAQQSRIAELESKLVVLGDPLVVGNTVNESKLRIAALEAKLALMQEDAFRVERLHRDRIELLELRRAEDADADAEIAKLERAANAPTASAEIIAEDLTKVTELSKRIDEGLAWIETARRVFQPVIEAFQRAPLDGEQVASRKIVDDQLALLARTLRTEINDKISAKLNEASDLARAMIAKLGPTDPRDTTGAAATLYLEVARKLWVLWDREAIRIEAEKKPGRLESFIYAVTGTRR